MGLLNCWNWKNCGRQPGGAKAKELGVCPAATCNEADGFLGGRGGGRACIYLTGTLCGGKVQGTFDEKHENCLKCDYYMALKKEFRAKVSTMKFNEYKSLPNYQKNKTNSNQDWVAKNKSSDETAEAAKRNYS